MKYADIIVDISAPNLDKSFTYEIPDELGELSIGTPVMIPFGAGNKQKKGYVCGIRSTRPEGNFKLKKIEGIVKNSLTIEDEFMALAYKMKTNYGGMLKDSLRTVIPVKQKVDLKKGAARKDAFPEITELIKKAVSQPAPEHHPENPVEEQILERLPAHSPPCLLCTVSSQQEETRKTDEIHQPVPTHGHRTDRKSHRVKLRMDQHESDLGMKKKICRQGSFHAGLCRLDYWLSCPIRTAPRPSCRISPAWHSGQDIRL